MTDLEEVQERFRMTDGFNLFYRCWRVSGEIDRVVVCIHGIPGDSRGFNAIGPSLAADGNQVYALDLRGIANSKEENLPKGDVRDLKRNLQDLDEAVSEVRRNHPRKKVYMLGYSLGGAYALWHAANRPDSLDGLVLAAPAIVVPAMSTRKASFLLFFANIFVPKMMYNLVQESELVKAILQDHIGSTKVSIRYLASAKRTLVEKALENASRIDKPTLILQGEADDAALPIGAKRLYESLRTKQKTIQTFPDADHGFLSYYATFSAKYDLAKREHVFSVVKDWLRTH